MFRDINSLTSSSWEGEDGCVITDIGGVKVFMLIDSGAMVNAVSQNTFDMLRSDGAQLLNVTYDPIRHLRAYAAEDTLQVSASFQAKTHIAFKDQSFSYSTITEEFYVIKNATRNLLGKTTAIKHQVLAMGMEVRMFRNHNSIKIQDNLAFEINSVVPKFEAFNMQPVMLKLREDVVPTKIRYTNIPFHLFDQVKAQIDELVKSDVIEEVTNHYEISWISSMLAIIKPNGKIRLVVDLRGPNKAIIKEPCGMPTLDSIISKLTGCTWFSTIDLTNAFHHVMLDKASRYVTTFWTGERYYRYKRLPFGLSSAPDIFQKALQDIVLRDCENALNYLDDIIVYSKSREQHKADLERVMLKLKKHNVKLNLEKCVFMQNSVKFLGFTMSGDGVSIAQDKMEAFTNLREPENISEVKSYLGMLTFLERFVINRAERTKHLREIANSKSFKWSPEAQAEFDALKEIELKRIASLSFFSKNRQTELYVDASPTGLGAILTQFDDNGQMYVICCASKALTPTEKRYPQQHKEALAMAWGVERFRFYLLGAKFIIKTDNRANEFIFGSDAYKQDKRAVTRSQLMALKLQPYSFKVKRVAGKDNAADALSRLIRHDQVDEGFEKTEGESISAISEALTPVSSDDIEQATVDDEVFLSIKDGLELDVWKNASKGFRGARNSFKIWGNILFFNKRFYIPKTLRMQTLKAAHQGHVSSSSMKQLLREHAWWPGMTIDVDSYHSQCRGCALTSKSISVPSLSPRELPSRPMEIVHLDFLKLTGIGDVLVVTDAYSRYLWVIEMKTTSTHATNKALTFICDNWGKPKLWQSDNGPQFISKEFRDWWKGQGVETRTTIPYAPHTNGLVERHNGPIIHAVKVALVEQKPWKLALAEYVKAYNTRPHSSTKFSPFHLLQGRQYHDYIPIFEAWDGKYELPPSRSVVKQNHDKAKARQKKYYDEKFRTRNPGIKEGDWVVLKNPNRINKMDPWFIIPKFRVMRIHKAMAIVRSTNGKDFIRWIGHLKPNVEGNFEVPATPVDDDVLSELLRANVNLEEDTNSVKESTISLSKDSQALLNYEQSFENLKPKNDETIDKEATNELHQSPSDPSASDQSQEDFQRPDHEVSRKFNLRNRKLISIPSRYLDCVFDILE